MLLKQLLESPKTSSKLLVFDPFREPEHEELVQEVIGLANAAVEGPRNILFGVNPSAESGAGIVGIKDCAMAELKKAHRLLSALIEPVVHLAFIYDRINGKLVGTLEIDGCDDGPYVVARDYSDRLKQGGCWIREGWGLRPIEAADIAPGNTSDTAEQPVSIGEAPPITVGFNDQPECQLLELSVPDTSNPPFASSKPQDEQPTGLRKTIKDTIGTVTTQILRLRGASEASVSVDSADEDIEVQTNDVDGAEAVLVDADNHYFFEEKALKLNLAVRNEGDSGVEDVTIKLGFPRLTDFDVAERIYVSPFDKRSPQEIRNLGYPKVERGDGAVIVRDSIGSLDPGDSEQAFKCALRLAVGPGMQGRKIAIRYTLRGPTKQCLGKGRLKIKFGKMAA